MPKSEVSITSSPSFAGVFSKEIYEVTWPKEGTEEEKLTAVLKEFDKNKEKALEAALLKRTEQRIAHLKSIIKTGKTFGAGLREGISGIPFIGRVWKDVSDCHVELPRDKAKEELAELELSCSVLKDGLKKESIYDLEKRYIKIKHSLENFISKGFCRGIEESLLLCREEGVPVQLVRQFIQVALDMPVYYKTIDTARALKLKDQPFMKYYAPAVQQELQLMAYQIATDSNDPHSLTPKRRVMFLVGDPSTGKSIAIRQMAKYLGLPIHFANIRSSADLTPDKLEGGIRTMMSQNPGYLAEALLETNEEGQRYLNGFLVLDDFDRALFNEDGTVNQSALAFLLKYLESELESYYSSYFDAKVNIRRLNIAISCNRPIPRPDPALPVHKDTLAALRSRVRQLHFPAFTEEAVRAMLADFLSDIGKKNSINADGLQILLNTAIEHEKKIGTCEPRSVKRRIEDMAGRMKLDLPLIPDEAIEFGPKAPDVNDLAAAMDKVSIGTCAPAQDDLEPLPAAIGPEVKKKGFLKQFDAQAGPSKLANSSSSSSETKKRRISCEF